MYILPSVQCILFICVWVAYISNIYFVKHKLRPRAYANNNTYIYIPRAGRQECAVHFYKKKISYNNT